MDTVSQHGNITQKIVLNGDLSLSNKSNEVILKQYRSISKERKDFKRRLIGYTRINRYLYQTNGLLKSDSDTEHTSMISVETLLHSSQSQVTSHCIHCLLIDLLHSSSFLFPSLFFFVFLCFILCNLFLSFFFLFSIYVCSSLHVKLHNYYLLINCCYLKRTTGN